MKRASDRPAHQPGVNPGLRGFAVRGPGAMGGQIGLEHKAPNSEFLLFGQGRAKPTNGCFELRFSSSGRISLWSPTARTDNRQRTEQDNRQQTTGNGHPFVCLPWSWLRAMCRLAAGCGGVADCTATDRFILGNRWELDDP